MHKIETDKLLTNIADEVLISTATAARRLGVSQRTIRRMVADGRINHIRLGRSVRITVTELSRIAHGAHVSGGANDNSSLVKPQGP